MKYAFRGAARAPVLAALAASWFPLSAIAEDVQIALRADAPAAPTAGPITEIVVTAQRLNEARNALSPKTGGNVYRFDADDIGALPEGASTGFNQVLLQAPGVANDSFGQLHIRGDHGNLQYRINGVILPEGISGFGQALDTRFAKRIELLNGALPAQYGYRTAGVVEIETNALFERGGRLDWYGGSHGTTNPSVEFGDTVGKFSYYLTGSTLRNDLGIENPTSSENALHDRTTQDKGFAYLSYVLDAQTRLSFMAGTYTGRFQIPNNPGQSPDPDGHGFLSAIGLADFDSGRLDERQRETNRYAIASLQGALSTDFDYQLSVFERYTSVRYVPDPIGDLAFNGVAAQVLRSSRSSGLQGDGSWRLNDVHTLRMGLFASTEDVRSDNTATVFPVDANGDVSGAPFTLVDNNARNGNRLLGLYLQDEWKASERLTVNYGLRYDKLDAFIKDQQWSPRLGLVFKATPDTTIHAAYARYFTPPPTELVSNTSLALFTNTSNAPEVAQNSPVKAERSHYFDAGIEHQLTPALNVGVDAFYKRITNLLDEGQFGQALIFTPFNFAQGRIYGIELSATYHAERLSAYANLARTTSRAKQVASAEFNFGQDELDYIADHWVHTDHDQALTASAGISYQWQGATLTADATYGSGLRRGFANTEHLPSYVQVNLGASRIWKTAQLGAFETRIALVNAFDRIYELRDGSGIGVGAPQFGPRRGIFLGVSKLL